VSADLSKIAPPLEAAECSDAMLPRFSPRFDACQPCTASRAYHRKRRSAGKMVSLTYPHDREIVVYCACPNEASAAIAAKHLKQAGFRKIRPLLGGIDAWVQAGQPLEHAPNRFPINPA
jgi:rhodanese-related sulfurtransferase